MSAFDEILYLLDQLSREEQLHLISIISDRLRESPSHVEDAEGEEEDEDEEEPGRRYLPRLPRMLEWGVIRPHDRLYVIDHEDQPALLLNDREVVHNAVVMLINDWATQVKGWESISIYRQVVVERLGKTLGEIRREYMDQHGLE